MLCNFCGADDHLGKVNEPKNGIAKDYVRNQIASGKSAVRILHVLTDMMDNAQKSGESSEGGYHEESHVQVDNYKLVIFNNLGDSEPHDDNMDGMIDQLSATHYIDSMMNDRN